MRISFNFILNKIKIEKTIDSRESVKDTINSLVKSNENLRPSNIDEVLYEGKIINVSRTFDELNIKEEGELIIKLEGKKVEFNEDYNKIEAIVKKLEQKFDRRIGDLEQKLNSLDKKLDALLQMNNSKSTQIFYNNNTPVYNRSNLTKHTNLKSCSEINSLILDSPEMLEKIKSAILGEREVLRRKVINFNLMHRASSNGDHLVLLKEAFANKDVLILIKSTSGFKFGGYKSIPIEITESILTKYYPDDNAFIFSVDLLKIYLPKKRKEVVGINTDDFGFNKGFIIGHRCMTKAAPVPSFDYKMDRIYNNVIQNTELIDGYDSYVVKELEIFQVTFE